MSDKQLRSKLIRLAHEKPRLRSVLVPLIISASWSDYAHAERMWSLKVYSQGLKKLLRAKALLKSAKAWTKEDPTTLVYHLEGAIKNAKAKVAMAKGNPSRLKRDVSLQKYGEVEDYIEKLPEEFGWRKVKALNQAYELLDEFWDDVRDLKRGMGISEGIP
jgi:hypothetical protein